MGIAVLPDRVVSILVFVGIGGVLDDVLECWPILLIRTGRWTFPEESAKVGCGDDSGSTHVLNEFLVDGHTTIASPIPFLVHKGATWCGNRAIDASGYWSCKTSEDKSKHQARKGLQ